MLGVSGYLVCRCGVIHERVEDRDHHDCLHGNDLMSLGKVSETELQVCCPSCGMAWVVDFSTSPTGTDLKYTEGTVLYTTDTVLYTTDYDRKLEPKIVTALEGLK